MWYDHKKEQTHIKITKKQQQIRLTALKDVQVGNKISQHRKSLWRHSEEKNVHQQREIGDIFLSDLFILKIHKSAKTHITQWGQKSLYIYVCRVHLVHSQILQDEKFFFLLKKKDWKMSHWVRPAFNLLVPMIDKEGDSDKLAIKWRTDMWQRLFLACWTMRSLWTG